MMDLAKKTFECQPERFIAGTDIRITTAAKVADGALAAHTPVTITGGKVKAITSAENLTGLYGLSADSAENNKEAVIFLTGEFFADSIVLPEGVKASDIEVAFRNIGIFLK